MKVYKTPENKIFNNCDHFPSDIRMLIIGSSGSGKTQLLFNLLLNQCEVHNKPFLDYNKLILVSPSLAQTKYQWLIKSYQAKLYRNQIEYLFANNNLIKNIDKEINELSDQNEDHPNNIEIITYDDPDKLPTPQELKSNKKTLIIVDDSMTKNKKKVEEIYCYGRP